MSIRIKKDAWQIKDDNGVYRSADLFSTMLPSEAKTLVAETRVEFTNMQNQLTSLAASKTQEITNEGSTQVTAVNTKGQEVLASIPNDYTTVSHAVDAVLQGGFIYNAVNGDVANFDDGADGMFIKSLVANIELKQDLHGYDRPWLGGAGKNLLPPRSYGDGLVSGIDATTIDGGNGVHLEGTATGNPTQVNYCLCDLPAGTYSVFGFISEYPNGVMIRIGKQTIGGELIKKASASDNTFSLTEATRIGVRIVIGRDTILNHDIYPMICLSTETDDTFAPYENICPITGWTELNGVRVGGNLYDASTNTSGYLINQSGVISKDSSFEYTALIPVTPEEKYRIYGYMTYSGNRNLRVHGYDSSGNWIQQITAYNTNAIGTIEGQFDVPATVSYLRLSKSISFVDVDIAKVAPISVNWQSTAGTVYGAMLDIVSGKMMVNKYGTDMGSLTWVYDNNSNIMAVKKTSLPYAVKIKSGGQIMGQETRCSCYRVKNTTYSSDFYNDNKVIAIGDSHLSNLYSIMVNDHDYTDPAVFKTAMTGQTLVYELAEPIEHQLTPQEVTTLLGVNRVWVDTGDVTVTYPVDTKTYIDRKIQEAIDGLSGS